MILFPARISSNIGKSGQVWQHENYNSKLGTPLGISWATTFLVGGRESSFSNRIHELLRKYNIKDRGGRREVEATAKKLQELEARGDKSISDFHRSG